ncbi:unnamed protein product [Schistosoma curassoni]|uniref:Myb_CC_LHEQLE domain-containing protein n=1 Tax=Schistosoma curassoni TaxID=6186 RepID=A0A183L4X7_9TREM|nr:unnamed protein product [Schistosoma curassoni]
MKTSTSEGKHGIQWTARNQLEDLDFAHDLPLLSHTHEQIQMKTTSMAAASESEESERQEVAVIMLQQLIRGRAIQTQMYEGKRKRSELIAESRSTHALLEDEQAQKKT